jgi:GT2 family glycosyltransferase
MPGKEIKSYVKASLLQLSLINTILEKLVEIFPRRIVCAVITPVSDLIVYSSIKGEYKAISKSPRFSLEFKDESMSGWYYLEASLVRNNGSRISYIEVIGSNRYKISIPTNLRGTVREVFFLPSDTRKLYWLPADAPGLFSQTPLLIHKISAAESCLRRIHRVVYDLWRFRNINPSARAGLTWVDLFKSLEKSYERSAKLWLERLAGNDYTTFIKRNETPRKYIVRAIKSEIRRLSLKQSFSLIMPVHDGEPKLLEASLLSILEQIYPEWELLIITTLPKSDALHKLALSYALKDARIKIIHHTPAGENSSDMGGLLGIGLEAAQGNFVACIGSHDQLSVQALYYLAVELTKYPQAYFIYTDNDELTTDYQRINPCFKPDWNPDLIASHNYIGSLAVFHRNRLIEIGGFHAEFEGAEEYEAILRFLNNVPETSIHHIPRVLYHRHVVQQKNNNSCVSHKAGKKALNQIYFKTGIRVEDGPRENTYWIKHPLPKQLPLVSIIIPTRDNGSLLKNCIQSIQRKTAYTNWELIIVDNQSVEMETLSYFQLVQRDQRIRLIEYNKSFNYSDINNSAAKQAKGEVLAFLNNDVEVIAPNWLTELTSHAMRLGIGAVGAKLLFSNGTIQHAGVVTGIGGIAGHIHKFLDSKAPGYCSRAELTQNLSAVTGACMVVAKHRFEEVGGMSHEFAVAFNDVDLCLKLITKGYRNIFTPFATLYHHESMTRGRDDTPQKRKIFMREYKLMQEKWGEMLFSDPAYNPNLTLEFEDFSVRRN